MCIQFKFIHYCFPLLVACIIPGIFLLSSTLYDSNSKPHASSSSSLSRNLENQMHTCKKNSNNLRVILDDYYQRRSTCRIEIGCKITRNMLSVTNEDSSSNNEDVRHSTATDVVVTFRTRSNLTSSQMDSNKLDVNKSGTGEVEDRLESHLNGTLTETFQGDESPKDTSKDGKIDYTNVSAVEVESEVVDKYVVKPPLDASQEDIPSFREWAEKHLAEKEKEKGDDNVTNVSNNGKSYKMGNKNYASLDCGAKLLSTNSEMKTAGSLLSTSRDEYLLSPCNSKIWFVVELCEAVQLKKVEMANFELFSSSPKEFSVLISDRFPSRDWTAVGQFSALDVKSIQSFDLQPDDHFTKYIKVEFHSHYGSEHYCPISLFRVYGTSEFEALEPDDENEGLGLDLSDSDYDVDEPIISDDNGKKEGPSSNIFGSAREAVMNMVKKAAEVLVKSPSQGGSNLNTINDSTTAADHFKASCARRICCTPRYMIFCRHCKEDFFHRLFQLISCRLSDLDRTLQNDVVWKPLIKYNVCLTFGITPFYLRDHATALITAKHIHVNELYVFYLLSRETIAALCNVIAIRENRLQQNVTTNETLLLNQTLKSDNSSMTLTIYDNLDSEHESATDLKSASPSSLFKIVDHVTNSSTLLQGSEIVTAQIGPAQTVVIDSNVIDHPTATSMPTYVPIFPDIISKEQIKIPVLDESLKDGDHGVEIPEDAMSLDSLISELEKTENTNQVASNSFPTAIPKPIVQKESVFVRLANRIKALERNMSLSGQYLEELSKRYKKQVEDMQRVLSDIADRELKKSEELNVLTGRVVELTLVVDALLSERDSWSYRTLVVGKHSVIVMLEIIIFIGIVCLFRGFPSVEISRRKFSLEWHRGKLESQNNEIAPVIRRGQSLDDLNLRKSPQHKRRPSEEALKLDGATHHELLIYDTNRSSKAETRRKKRKRRELLLKSNANAINLETGGDNFKRKLTPVKSNAPLSRSASTSEIDDHSWGRIVDRSQRYSLEKENMYQEETGIFSLFKTATSMRTKRVSSQFIGKNVLSPVYDVSSDQDSSVPTTPIKEKKINGIKRIVKKFF